LPRLILAASAFLACAPALTQESKPIGLCRATFEQDGNAGGLPRWYAVIDRNPSDPSLVRGTFGAVVTFTMRTLHRNGVIDGLTGWVVSNGVNTTRVELEFGRYTFNAIKVDLFTCVAYEASEQ
jgi:hypothetical protein